MPVPVAPVPGVQPHQSSIGGIEANVMAMLTYIASLIISFIPGLNYVAWLVPIFIFFIESKSPFVRFHAIQAFALQCIGSVCIVFVTLGIGGVFITFIRTFSGVSTLAVLGIVGLMTIAISVFLWSSLVIGMVKAYRYQEHQLRVTGRLAGKMAALLGGLART